MLLKGLGKENPSFINQRERQAPSPSLGSCDKTSFQFGLAVINLASGQGASVSLDVCAYSIRALWDSLGPCCQLRYLWCDVTGKGSEP